jgi:DNA-binding NarL/FixJ family response regulator
MSYVLFQTGEWQRAIDISRELMSLDSIPDASRASAECVLGLVRVLRGESREARKNLRSALGNARRLKIRSVEIFALWGCALQAELEKNDKISADYHLAIIEHWEQTGERHDSIPALCYAAAFFSRHNMEREMARCTEALGTIASATGNPEALAGLCLALGESAILAGDPSEAARQFKQAQTHLESLEIPLLKAYAQFRTGDAYARAGDSDRAGKELTSGYRLARNLAARPMAATMAEILRKMGKAVEEQRDSKSPARSDRAGLTRRQLEVAQLLAAGLTNKEIAEKLFLSHRTVDMHVANILNRLDCRSRTEAVRRVSDLGLIG